jgi:LPS O-antigen subunit length determinant protein (WzzB/FepE family)
MLILKMDNPYLLMFATALIGGLVAGFGALTASFIREKNKIIFFTYIF